MKWLLTLTVSVILLAGCATLGFKDEPAFSEGEATAIVKSKVAEDYAGAERAWNNLEALSKSSEYGLMLTKFNLADHRFDNWLCGVAFDGLKHRNLERSDSQIKETYLGDGVWLVERTTPVEEHKSRSALGADYPDFIYLDISLSWRVYETSKTVEFTGSYYYQYELQDGQTGKTKYTPIDSCPHG